MFLLRGEHEKKQMIGEMQMKFILCYNLLGIREEEFDTAEGVIERYNFLLKLLDQVEKVSIGGFHGVDMHLNENIEIQWEITKVILCDDEGMEEDIDIYEFMERFKKGTKRMPSTSL